MNTIPGDLDLDALSRSSLEASHVAQVIVDEAQRVVLASTGAERLFRMPRRELEARSMTDLMAGPDVLSGCKSASCSAEGCFRQIDLVVGSSTTAVEMHCELFVDPAGRPHRKLTLYDEAAMTARNAMRTARIAKLSLLNQVSEALYGAQLSLPQVLESVLIAMTAGQGLRFNRAFLLLVDERTRTLRGEIAIGPSSKEEAQRIWRDLAEQPTDLYEMMTSYDLSLRETDAAVNAIVRDLQVDLAQEDHILIKAMHSRRVVHVVGSDEGPGLDDVRQWLGVSCFAVAPLATRRGAIGVLIADNAISGLAITELDLEFLQLFANQ